MQAGYLYLVTHPAHPGLIRVLESLEEPAAEAGFEGGAIRYIARFSDLDAAKMHAHAAMRRRLVDVDAGLYRIDLAGAMAAVESIDLRHQRSWLDPSIEQETLARMAERAQRHRARQRLVKRIAHVVGAIGIGLLLLNALSGI